MNIEKKTIIYIVKHSLPNVRAGYTIRTDNIVKLWQENNNVYTISLMGDGKDELEYNDVKYYNLNLKSLTKETYPTIERKINLLMKKKNISINNANVIVIAASNYMVGRIGYLISKLLNVDFWYDVRGFWELSASSNPNGRYSADSKWFRNYVYYETKVCQKAQKVLAITRQVKTEICKRGIEGEKIIIFNNFIHPSNIIKINQNKNNQNSYINIGYFGSLNYYEGVNDLIDSFNSINIDTNITTNKKAKLYIISNTQNIKNDDNYDNYKNKNIMFKNVDYNDIHKYYSIMDLVCIPRKRTRVTEIVSPIKLIEAIELERNILISDLEPLVDIMNSKNYKNNSIIFKAGDTNDLIKKLRMFIQKK